MREPALDQLIALSACASAAAIAPDRWPAFMRELEAAFGSASSSLEMTNKITGECRLQTLAPMGQQMVETYEEQFATTNPRVSLAVRTPIGAITHDRLIPDEIWRRNGDYLEWLGLAGIGHFVGAKVIDTSTEVGFFCVHYASDEGYPEEASITAASALIPHLANAFAVATSLSRGIDWYGVDDAALSRDGRAFALLDSRGLVTEASNTMQAVLRAGDVLRCSRGKLIAGDRLMQGALDRLITHAVAAEASLRAPPPVRLTAPARPRGVVLRAVGLKRHGDFLDAVRPSGLLTLTDLDAPLRTIATELRSLWGLTPREAQIALYLAEGRSIDEAAALTGMSGHTARHHQKSIYRSLEVERHVELVALIARLGR